MILNEVLSLNAQEFCGHTPMPPFRGILNEVLSLNAQESLAGMRLQLMRVSSMKS